MRLARTTAILAALGVSASFGAPSSAQGDAARLASGRVVDVHGKPIAGAAVTLSIRPEQLQIVRAGDGAIPLGRGRIGTASFQGTHLRAHVAMEPGGAGLLLRAPSAAGLAPGDAVELSVRPVDIVMLRG